MADILTLSANGFFVKTLRDGGCRLEMELQEDDVPRVMALTYACNKAMQSGAEFKITISDESSEVASGSVPKIEFHL